MSRVLFVSQTAEPGGAELFLRDVLLHGPSAWRAAFLSDGPVAQHLARHDRLAGVVSGADALLALRREGAAAPKALLSALGAARRLNKLRHDTEILCPTSQKALVVCAMAATLRRGPLVWILHDIITDPAFSASNRRAAIFLSNAVADEVVVNSRATASALLEAGGKAASIVYNGFDTHAWPQRSAIAGEKTRAAFSLDHRPIASCFGRLTEWKGQHIFLQALSQTPDVQGLVVGGPLFGEEAYENRLHQICADLGVADRVKFTGHRNDVAELMAGSDIVVHASTHAEPFGRVLVEGQLSGAPVIATDAGGVRDIVAHGITGWLVRPGDATALASALQHLVASPDVARDVAQAGRASALAQFDITKTCSDLVTIFDRVLRASHER